VDAWDRWNRNRTAQLGGAPRNGQYVSSNVAGVDDLDRAGAWHETPRYGPVWVPRNVPADWAPYSTGRWVWDPYYGWTWIDDAPWGWAPYHYGRWVWTDDAVWGWAPGPVVTTAVYAPALVAFFGPVGVSVNVGVGFPFVSWVALGFGEPVFPWWGPIGFIGRPFWCGWGGPRIVNNVFINNTRIVNAQNVTAFRNMTVRNAVMAVHRDQFGRGAVQPAHLTTAQAQHVQPVRGQLGVRPTAASLAPATGHAVRPPDRIASRRVVATRPPQDPTRSLRTAGLAATGAARSAPRIVEPTARSKGVQMVGRTRPPLPQTQHHPGSAPATGVSRQAPQRGVASGPSHTSTPSRGFASGPRRAATPPRGVASGPGRTSTLPRGFASSPRAPQTRRSFQPRPSFQPRASVGPPRAATSGRGGPPAARSRGPARRG
jgi:hypothetical protein